LRGVGTAVAGRKREKDPDEGEGEKTGKPHVLIIRSERTERKDGQG
jgi:hypothetical protein